MAISLDRTALTNLVQKLKDFTDYKTKVSSAAAQAIVLVLVEEQMKCVDKNGEYFAGASASDKAKVKLTPKSVIKCKDEKQQQLLLDRIGTMLMGDVMLMTNRQKYIGELLAKAKKGDLRKELDKNLEPEANYYKAPSKAPKDPEVEKAKAWLKKGVTGSTTEYDKAVDANMTTDGKNPLGADEKVLYGVWKKLVTDAPDWRSFNQATPYPSSIAGMHILKKLMADVAKEKLPARGDAAWEDWALFLFGAVMTSQPFSDGNKRACRALYAIMMASAGIPFRAPTDKFGSKLGAMS